MKNVIKNYVITGPCTLYVDKLVKLWNDKFSISQWHDEYRLVKSRGKGESLKATISTEQALEIIKKLNLLPVHDTLFKNGKSWKTKLTISSDRNKLIELLELKYQEINVLNRALSECECALQN